jgi:hypothetical protein
MLVSKRSCNYDAIEMQKFTDHPIGVGRNPKYDGEVMTKLTHNFFRSPTDDDGN